MLSKIKVLLSVMKITCIFVGIFALLLIIMLIGTPNARLREYTNFDKVNFRGEFSTNGGSFVPIDDITDITTVDAEKTAVLIRGKLNHSIPENVTIFYRAYNQYVCFYVNGVIVHEYGLQDDQPNMVTSIGGAYISFTSPGITPEDDVSIYTFNIQDDASTTIFSDFLDSIHYGNEILYFRELFKASIFELLFGITSIIVGLMFVIAYITTISTLKKFSNEFVTLGLIMICCGIFCLSDSYVMSYIIPYPFVIMTTRLLSLQLMSLATLTYFTSIIKNNYRIFLIIVTIISALVFSIEIFLQASGESALHDLYYINCIFMFIYAITTIICIFIDYHKYHDKYSLFLMITACFIGGALTIESANYFLNLFRPSLILIIGSIVFLLLRVYLLFKGLYKVSIEMADNQRVKNELLQARIAVMLSQIKPHFIFNTLNAISSMMHIDPMKADDALISFSNYLRTRIDSLQDDSPIPFFEELKHVQYYVDIEKLRFNDRINIVYDIKYSDFMIPTLTIQPLVENAIKHGIIPKIEPGRLLISTQKVNNKVLITIKDDGVGFDIKKIRKKSLRENYASRISIGLSNVENRLKYTMKAEMKVVSEVGVGTTVSILIPLNNKTIPSLDD